MFTLIAKSLETYYQDWHCQGGEVAGHTACCPWSGHWTSGQSPPLRCLGLRKGISKYQKLVACEPEKTGGGSDWLLLAICKTPAQPQFETWLIFTRPTLLWVNKKRRAGGRLVICPRSLSPISDHLTICPKKFRCHLHQIVSHHLYEDDVDSAFNGHLHLGTPFWSGRGSATRAQKMLVIV